MTGWDATNPCGIEIQNGEHGGGYDGPQFVELASNCVSGITQTIDTAPARPVPD